MDKFYLKIIEGIKKLLSNKALQQVLISLLREQVKRTPETWDNYLVEAVAVATGNKPNEVEISFRFAKQF